MSWPKCVIIAWYALGALSTIALIGKPRKPVTPGFAIVTVLLIAALVALVVIA